MHQSLWRAIRGKAGIPYCSAQQSYPKAAAAAAHDGIHRNLMRNFKQSASPYGFTRTSTIAYKELRAHGADNDTDQTKCAGCVRPKRSLGRMPPRPFCAYATSNQQAARARGVLTLLECYQTICRYSTSASEQQRPQHASHATCSGHTHDAPRALLHTDCGNGIHVSTCQARNTRYMHSTYEPKSVC